MKWVIARRYIRPFMRRRKQVKRKYRLAFYNKQQLRSFYGRYKEEAFRNFFRAHLSGITKRNDSFYSSLERRADMFFFRARLLPTIYAANQFVRHQGILLNNGLEKSPNALVRPGYILTVQQEYWAIFAEVLEQRLFFRWHGYGLLKNRVFVRLKKKVRWISRLRKYHLNKQILLFRKFARLKRDLVPLKRFLNSEYKKRMNDWNDLVCSDLYNLYITLTQKAINARDEAKKRELRKKSDEIEKPSYLKSSKNTKTNRNIDSSSEDDGYHIDDFNITAPTDDESSDLESTDSESSDSELSERLNSVINEFNTFKEKTMGEENHFLFQNNRYAKFLSLHKRSKRKVKTYIKPFIVKKKKNLLEHSKFVISLKKKSKYIALRLKKQKKPEDSIYLKGLNVNLSNFPRSKFLRRNYWRKNDGRFFRKLTEIMKFYKDFLHLFGELKTRELKQQLFFLQKLELDMKPENELKELTNQTFENKMKSLMEKFEQRIEEIQFHLKESYEEIDEFVLNMLQRRVKYRRWKVWTIRNRKTGARTKSLRKTPLFYFIMRKRRKLRRRLAVPRLKGVHWYIPHYIYFDATSMQSIMLHHPLSRDIYFSFKGSLPKLYAYYKSR
jgi:ribosomal protein S4